jgi:molybdate transport system substrate-binding protein
MRIRSVVAVGVLAGLALASCSSGGGSSDSSSADPNTVSLVVAPAQEAVAKKLGAAYEKANPGKKVTVASMDQSGIQAAMSDKSAGVAFVPSGWLGGTRATGTLGRNLIVIAVPSSNPGNVAGLSAFGDNQLRTSVCGVETILGDFTLAILRQAKVTPRSSAISTSADCPEKAMSALAGGQLDAAVMFRNNVTVPNGVKTIAVPDRQNLVIPVQYVVIQQGEASRFGTFLASEPARRILTDNGYLP